MQKSLLVILLAASVLLQATVRDRSNDVIFLASYPRSGTHWTIYIIETFCQRTATNIPITVALKDGNGYTHAKKHRFDKTLTQQECGFIQNIVKLHPIPQSFFDTLQNIDGRYDLDDPNLDDPILQNLFAPLARNPGIQYDSRKPMIYVLRNYKEALISHQIKHASTHTDPYMAIQSVFSDQAWFIENLQFFDKLDPEERLLVYYEDLLDFPEREVSRIVTFITGKCDSEAVKEFCNDLSTHQKNSIDYYHNFSKSAVDVQNHRRYTGHLDIEALREADRHVQADYPHIWDTYLSRYAD